MPDPTATENRTFVDVSIEHGVARVRLNRPERLNAISPEVASELLAALDEAHHRGARVIVLGGAGRAFSSGHDLKEPDHPAGSPEANQHLHTLQHLTRRLMAPHVVSIAAIHGYALGAGAEIALACDIVLADQTAKIAFPEVQAGLSMTGGGSYLLPRIVGLSRAKKLMLLGETLDAATAHDWGLVAEVAQEGDLDNLVARHIDAIMAMPHQGLHLAKKSLLASMDATLEETLVNEIDNATHTLDSEELREARHRHWATKQ